MEPNQLAHLLECTEFISQAMKEMGADVKKGIRFEDRPDVPATFYIHRAIELRQSFRELIDGIEKNRMLAQIKKEKLERARTYHEGLQQYRINLENKVKETQIDVQPVNDYLEGHITIKNWIQDFDQAQDVLIRQLNTRIQKKAEFEELTRLKHQRQEMRNEKKKIYEKVLPQHARKIYKQIEEASKLFCIQDLDTIQDVINRDLAIIYDKFNPLRSTNLIDIVHTYGDNESLEITILKNGYYCYQQAKINRINIQEDVIKIWIISHADIQGKLVIGIESDGNISTKSVFDRLINDEQVKTIYINPPSKEQINTNKNLGRLDWIESALLKGLVSPQKLLELIKERVFCLQLSNYLCKDIAELDFYFPLVTNGQYEIPPNLKRCSVCTLNPIDFATYISLVQIPLWAEKYANMVKLRECLKSKLSISDLLKWEIDRCKIISALEVLKLDELIDPQVNNYFRGTFFFEGHNMVYILIVPKAYPHKPSKIRIIEWSKMAKTTKPRIILPVPCKCNIKIDRNPLHNRTLTTETEVNDKINEYMQISPTNPFRILLQLNRLLTIFVETKIPTID